MLRLRGQGRQWLTQALRELQSQEDFNRKGVPDLLNYLIDRGRTVRVLYIYGHWLDVNSLEDLEQAGHFAQGYIAKK